MKKGVFILLILVIAPLLITCDRNEESTLSALILVFHRPMAPGEIPGSTAANLRILQMSSVVFGTPLPSVNYIQLGEKKFTDIDNCNCSLMLTEYYNEVILDDTEEIRLNPLKAIVNSSIGEIEGTVTLPDTIKTLSVDAPDQIPVGTPVTVSWSGSNADYYEVRYDYAYIDQELWENEVFIDTIVTATQITFDSTVFSKNGAISGIRVRPINGPLMSAGARHNMSGDGYGYLILQNDLKRYNKRIIVGDGLPRPGRGFEPKQKDEFKENSEFLLKMAEKLGIHNTCMQNQK